MSPVLMDKLYLLFLIFYSDLSGIAWSEDQKPFLNLEHRTSHTFF
jgi:hypothetical protein